ncbi:hypothetical protein [Chroogloeocystis siderophila]|jgi:hypothetical protein|uniref:hypothetical protein n=1 Tax=Chroogloeocystis siderophila TaxID=329163 RepID=UPI000AB773E5|nr:hypothetical protein [Chroogloeocystis siderophila]
MIQVIQSRNIGIAYLEEKFCFQLVNEEQFFAEYLSEHYVEPTEQEKCYLDRVKSNYLNLAKQRPISEELVKMVILLPLLDLAGFYRSPLYRNRRI